MSRADRLLHLVQALRRRRRPVSAAALAAEFGVSERTIYRDIATLVSGGAPVRGEAGVGYVLEGGYDLPPMMLTVDEIDALILGMRWVAGSTDPELARAAGNLVAKVDAVLPPALVTVLRSSALFAPRFACEEQSPCQHDGSERPPDVGHILRRAVRENRVLRIVYRDGDGDVTRREIRPCGVAYLSGAAMAIAWCDLRGAFRSFRLDRFIRIEIRGVSPERREALLARWRQEFVARGEEPPRLMLEF